MRPLILLATTALVSATGCASDSSQAGAGASDPSQAPSLNSELLVTTEWLALNHSDPGVVVLHVATDRADYDNGHIPDAHFLPLSSIVVERDGNLNELPSVTHLDSVFESVGVSDASRVILYGAPLAATRAFFTLDYLGHGDRTALLDGGLEGWVASGLPTSTEPLAAIEGALTPRPDPELVVDAEWVSEHLDDPSTVLIDARPEAQYTGEDSGGVERPGHIPGASSLYWERLIESPGSPALLTEDSLRALFHSAGVEPGDTVVAYCRTGVQASFVYFVSRYLGYPTRLYDASYMDWSRRTELPVEH